MRERPILFSGPMVRAILSGRKTQTRRVVKPQPDFFGSMTDPNAPFKTLGAGEHAYIPCPYGQPGDRLWVRETWQGPLLDSEEHEAQFRDDGPEAFMKPGFCAYRATDTLDAIDADGNDLGWRPSIHMPRWASRILLEITAVRVERLQDICREDAITEAVEFDDSVPFNGPWFAQHGDSQGFDSPIDAFRALWESISGPGAWDANPWVWVIDFRRIDNA